MELKYPFIAWSDLPMTFSEIQTAAGSFRRMVEHYWQGELSGQQERTIEDRIPKEVLIGLPPDWKRKGVTTMYEKAGQVNKIDQPQSIEIDTVSNVLALIENQAQEINQRASGIANDIAGSLPEAGNEKQQTPNCLLIQLRMLSSALGRANNELERAQRSLNR